MQAPVPSRAALDAFLAGLGVKIAQSAAIKGPATSAKASAQAGVADVVKEGGRNTEIARIAGGRIHQGWPIEAVIADALCANHGFQPPLDNAEVRRTCESVLRTHLQNNATPLPAPPTPLFPVAEASIARMLATLPPTARWLLKDTLRLGIVGMLVASGGTGKSMFCIELAVALATGIRLSNHWEVDETGASLLLLAEDDEDEIHRRLTNVLAAAIPNGSPLEQAVAKDVHIKSMVSVDNLMTRAVLHRGVELTDYVDRLSLTANAIPNLRLIIIDPASRFRGGDENSAEDATRFVEALERLKLATGATVLVVHHANKGSAQSDEPNQGASRGSSALTDGVRWQMNMKSVTKTEAKVLGISEHDRHRYVFAAVTKNNYAAPQRVVLLERCAGGVLVVAQPAAGSSPAAAGAPEQKLIKLVVDEAAAGRKYTKNSLLRTFAGVSKPMGMSDARMRSAIAACISTGCLRARTTKPIGRIEATGLPWP